MEVTAKRVYSTVARQRAQGEEENVGGERRSVCEGCKGRDGDETLGGKLSRLSNTLRFGGLGINRKGNGWSHFFHFTFDFLLVWRFRFAVVKSRRTTWCTFTEGRVDLQCMSKWRPGGPVVSRPSAESEPKG